MCLYGCDPPLLLLNPRPPPTQAFGAFRKAATVHLVETSPHLRVLQKQALRAKPFPVPAWENTNVNKPTSSSSSGSVEANASTSSGGGATASTPSSSSSAAKGQSSAWARQESMRLMLPGGGAVLWHTHLASVPEGPILFIGQEILDALPVHQFEYTTAGW